MGKAGKRNVKILFQTCSFENRQREQALMPLTNE
jgi:hypothetical protein